MLGVAMFEVQPQMLLSRREHRHQRIIVAPSLSTHEALGCVRLFGSEPRVIQKLAPDQRNGAGLSLREGKRVVGDEAVDSPLDGRPNLLS